MAKTATVNDLPLLERRRIEALVLVPVIRAMQERFGTEPVNEVVGEAIRELARSQGEELAKAQPIETVVAIRERFSGGGPVAEGSLTIREVPGDDAHYGFDVTHCQFVDMYAELGAGDLGFLLSCNRDFASFAGMAPGLEFDRTQTRMQGASHCDFRYRDPASAAGS
ncbi:MAG: L-2-amino-thiazoline-4-carboxylic acid hydrolase [Acidimicrobiia bacterium]|nr:L-2-amino-thiazoline-4-carboxylic acid hydrolase [Acidimicrobiia bacterium]